MKKDLFQNISTLLKKEFCLAKRMSNSIKQTSGQSHQRPGRWLSILNASAQFSSRFLRASTLERENC